ncbi:hypothetical protein GCM10010389_29140 [Streptomyces echinoruber]|uniref:Uncharacterized protein n=1 Tax=Streptomyces echinoruber TaxID=68898 RepID=A0A918R7Z8_9ACTN|nr:hypothetical protein [Streptomyces echinoruber]GGZ89065.1 hypothetical protein GCM10010389_29140 [Streptomyces echinoruber]
MAGRTVRWGTAAGLGAVWWWAVLRLALVRDAGAWEGAVAAGGWGLSLLPVHCVPKERADGAVSAGRWVRAVRTVLGPALPGGDGDVGRGERRGTGGEESRRGRDETWPE